MANFENLTTNTEDNKALMAALKLAEERNAMLAAIVNSSQDAIISKDLQGIITSWNHSATHIFGYSASEMIGEPITKLIPFDRLDEELIIMSRLRNGDKVDHFRTKRLAKSGKLIDVSLSISPVRNSEGSIIGFSKMARDISELIKAEEQGAILSAIIASSDDAIISKDLNSIITSWNNSAERIFGYTEAEMIGQSILKLIPEDRQEEEPLILGLIKSGQRVDHFEAKRLTKWGTLIDVSLTISPVKDLQDNIIGVSKIARDISAQKLEEQRKKDFIAVVSHELKTPLTSMRSYVQMALSKVKKNGDKISEHLLDRAEVQTTKMIRMINDFLNLTRLEEGQMAVSFAKFSLPELMNEVLSEGAVLAQSHHIQQLSCPDIELYADREKIIHVMTNLIGNAVKYSSVGSLIEVNSISSADQLEISVRDQGIGISLEDQKYLFDRFYRVENEVVKNISGFGIGLYLVSEILRLHGTTIKVSSELGKGTTFSFCLPISPSASSGL